MAYADDIRTTDYTREELATLIEGVFGASTGIITVSTWSPTWGATGSMTFTSVTTHWANYFRVDDWVFYEVGAQGTTGGTASTAITFTLPATPSNSGVPPYVGSGWCDGTATVEPCTTRYTSGVAQVYLADGDNWQLDTGVDVNISGRFKVA